MRNGSAAARTGGEEISLMANDDNKRLAKFRLLKRIFEKITQLIFANVRVKKI